MSAFNKICLALVVACLAIVVVGKIISFFRKKKAVGEAGVSEAGALQVVDDAPKVEEKSSPGIYYTTPMVSKTPESTAKFVDYFVFDVNDFHWVDQDEKVMRRLGEKAYPRALEILKDQSLHQKLVTPTKTKGLPEYPINRLCMIFDLKAPPPQQVAELLVPFVLSQSSEIRKSVGRLLGLMGLEQSIPHLQKLLADEDGYVRSRTLDGIYTASIHNKLSSSLAAKLFDMVAGMWPDAMDFNVSKDIPKILLSLDRRRGMEYLLRDEVFTVKFEGLHHTLEVLVSEGIKDVSHERLLALINELKAGPMEYPREYMIRYALELLGMYRNPADLPLLEECLALPDKKIVEGAIKGLYHYHQFHEKVRDPSKISEKRNGLKMLTEAERYICEIQVLDSLICGDGFEGYYLSGSADQWKVARKGLKAIGAKEHLKIFEMTLAKFPWRRPSTDICGREDQLYAMREKKEDIFGDCDSAWYNAKENLDLLLFRYDIANPQGREKTPDSGPTNK